MVNSKMMVIIIKIKFEEEISDYSKCLNLAKDYQWLNHGGPQTCENVDKFLRRYPKFFQM